MTVQWVRTPRYDEEAHRKVDAGSVHCGCGYVVELHEISDSDREGCGNAFNSYGQRLAPPELWEG